MKRLKFKTTAVAVVCILLTTLPGCREKLPQKNIILMITDGCGYNCFEAASYYQFGDSGTQIYDTFPVKFAVSTYSASSTPYDPAMAWASFDFVLSDPTDSAAAATALATGTKTNDEVVGMGPDLTPLKSIVEWAEEEGKSTGSVTSVTFCHATPASFLAHASKRRPYEPIARQIIRESAADVVMGCGHPDYDIYGNPVREPNYRYVGDAETWKDLLEGRAGADADGDGKEDPWTVIQTRKDFQAYKEGPTPKRVFGIPRILQTLQQGRRGDPQAPAFISPLIDTVPTLSEMSLAALNVLDENPHGFFLLIEGGAVDWAGEDNQAGRIIEEQIDFNHAVEAVVRWIEANGGWENNLLVVTSDHETGYITGPGSEKAFPISESEFSRVWPPLLNNGKGKMPGMEWHSDYHTNSLVPFFAKGYGCLEFYALADEEDPIRGRYADNAEIGRLLIEQIRK